MNENLYLSGMPPEIMDHGLCKTLLVRREIIHIKHILTEIFVRKSIDIEKELASIDISLFEYMEYLTNRIRRIHHFSRSYVNPPDDIVKTDCTNFFPSIEFYKGLQICLALDFDGTVTATQFHKLYDLCLERVNTVICSANPTVSREYFEGKKLGQPKKIYANKGKKAKIKRLINLSQRNDVVFFVDNEDSYLELAWLFGIKTFKWCYNRITYFTRKTK